MWWWFEPVTNCYVIILFLWHVIHWIMATSYDNSYYYIYNNWVCPGNNPISPILLLKLPLKLTKSFTHKFLTWTCQSGHIHCCKCRDSVKNQQKNVKQCRSWWGNHLTGTFTVCKGRFFSKHFLRWAEQNMGRPHYRIRLMYSDLSKQCRPRWDVAESGISSGYTLLANHLAIFLHKYGKELRCPTT